MIDAPDGSQNLLPPQMSLEDIENVSDQGLSQSMESNRKLFGAISSMITFSKQQSEHIEGLERTVKEQKDKIEKQKEEAKKEQQALMHRLKVFEAESMGRCLIQDEINRRTEAELDKLTEEWVVKKESGQLDEELRAKEKAVADAAAAAAAEAEELKRKEAEIAEKEAQMAAKQASLEEDEKRRAQESQLEMNRLTAIEDKVREDQRAAAAAALEAEAAAQEAKIMAEKRMALKVTHANINAIADGIVSEFENAAADMDEARLVTLVRNVVEEEIGAEAMDVVTDKYVASIVAAPRGDLDALIDATEELLCECFGLHYRKRLKAPAPAALAVASIDPAQLEALTSQIKALEDRLMQSEAAHAEAMSNIPTNSLTSEAMSEAIDSALNKALPSDLSSTLDGARRVIARVENGEFDHVPHMDGPPPEFLNKPAPAPLALPFPVESIVRYEDMNNTSLPPTFMATIRNELNFTETITNINVTKADSDDLAKLRTAMAELSNRAVSYEALDKFADLGSKVGAGEVTNAAIKMRETMAIEVKKNVDLQLANLRKEMEDLAQGNKAFTKLECQRVEDRMTAALEKERKARGDMAAEFKATTEKIEETLANMSDRINSLMWTQGAISAATDEVVKNDPVEDAKREDQLRREMKMVQDEVSAAIQEMQYNIQSAGRRAEIAERGVTNRATNERLEQMIAETLRAVNSSLGENVDELKQTMHEMALLLNHKPSREEVLGLFSSSGGGRAVQDEDTGFIASGTAHCISCGSKRATSPPRARPMSVPATVSQSSLTWQDFAGADIPAHEGLVPGGAGDSLVFDDNISPPPSAPGTQEMQQQLSQLSQSGPQPQPNKKRVQMSVSVGTLPTNGTPAVVLDKAFVEKYNEVMEVVQGRAGLRSLQRQTTPMKARSRNYLKKRDQPPEPLYRRARLAQSIRESTKLRPPRSAPGQAVSSLIIYDDDDTRRGGALPQLSPGKTTTRQQQILLAQQRRAADGMKRGDVYPVLSETYPSSTPLPQGGNPKSALDELSLGSVGDEGDEGVVPPPLA